VEVPGNAAQAAVRAYRADRAAVLLGLRALSPVIEITGLILISAGVVLGVVDLSTVALFLLIAYGYAIVVTLAAMAVEELSFHRYPALHTCGGGHRLGWVSPPAMRSMRSR
jgi:hypothetical protein